MSNTISSLEIPGTNKRPNYTEEEDKKIADFIANNSYRNLAEAFDAYVASDQNTANRSASSVHQRYQKHLKHNHNMFVIANSKGGMQNTKYAPRESEPDYKPTEFIVKMFLDLDRQKRNDLLDIFKKLQDS